MFAMFLYITLYIQNTLGFSPQETGLRFLPLTVVSFFVAPAAGRISRTRAGRGPCSASAWRSSASGCC